MDANSATSSAGQAINFAATKDDRWLFIATAVVLLIILVGIIWRMEKHIRAQQDRQDKMTTLAQSQTERLIEVVTANSAMLDRATRALEQNWDILKERIRK